MGNKEKMNALQKHVLELSNHGNLQGARSCLALWEEIVCVDLNEDKLAEVQPHLVALRDFLGSR